MIPKTSEKNKAVALRMKGYSYSEILERIPVAKSTLSLWLHDVGLSKRVQHVMTEKKILAAKRGGAARKLQADRLRSGIYAKSEKEIGKISKRELWLIGAALYWADGTKEKPSRSGSGVQFINSDPIMVKLFLKWLNEICHIKEEDIRISFYIHDTCRDKVEESISYWVEKVGIVRTQFNKIYFKKGNIKTRRQNIGNQYYGIVSISVSKSSELLRRITGWNQGIGNSCCGIV